MISQQDTYDKLFDSFKKNFIDDEESMERFLPMFKRMCSAVTKSNKNFIFDGNQHCDESTLIGKKIGMILGEEEYTGNDGSTKTRIYVAREISIDDLKAGKFKVPELKKLEETASAMPKPDDKYLNIAQDVDEETPFN